MEKLIYERTQSTPLVFFDYINKILTIEGVSLPENAKEFYSVVHDFIENYHEDDITIIHDLGYANSSSSKNILELLKKSIRNVRRVNIRWFYDEDDTDILETGEDIQDILGIKFEFIPKKRPRKLFYDY